MNAPLIELVHADLRLEDRAVLSDVTLSLGEGESWAILGANGSGKSSLLKLLRGDLWPLPSREGRRTFFVGGRPEASPIGLRERIGMVSPELQLAYARRDWELTVEAVVRSGFTDSVWPPEPASPAQAARIEEVLTALGALHLIQRSILSLSSGEMRKVLLARALANRPKLLFLDEPGHGLDAPSRADFLALVSQVARGGTSIVLATHRADELIPEISKVAILHGGRLLAQGDRREVLHRHGPPRPPPLKIDLQRAPSPAHDLGAEAAPGRTLIDLRHVDVKLDGQLILHDLSWHIRAGERWAVIGRNGAGKSTLLRLLVGDEQAADGRVSRLDLGERACVWEVKARVGIVSPELQARHRFDALAEDVVASGFFSSVGLSDTPSPEQRAEAARCMRRLGVEHLRGRSIRAISFGELRRLLLARALVHDPELLVLDEPCDGLDPEGRAALLEILQQLCDERRPIVYVSHHAEDLIPGIDHILELERGRTVYQGPRGAWRPTPPLCA